MVRGKNVSGRPWKAPTRVRTLASKVSVCAVSSGSVAAGKGGERQRARRAQERERRAQWKERKAALLEERKEAARRAREEREERERRKARNELRAVGMLLEGKGKGKGKVQASGLQVIKNAATIKRMNRKQLRQVKKTIVNRLGEVEVVDAFGQGSKRR